MWEFSEKVVEEAEKEGAVVRALERKAKEAETEGEKEKGKGEEKKKNGSRRSRKAQ